MVFLREVWEDLAQEQQNRPAKILAIRRKQSLSLSGSPRTCSCRAPPGLLAGPKFNLLPLWPIWKFRLASGTNNETGGAGCTHFIGGVGGGEPGGAGVCRRRK